MEQDRVCMKKGSNTKACTPGFKQKKKNPGDTGCRGRWWPSN